MSKQKNRAVRIIAFAVIVIGIVLLMRMVSGAGQTSEKYDLFAQCLSQKDVKLYSTFWCKDCQKQARKFDAGAKYLPVIECSTPDGKAVSQTCIDAGATTWPVWAFPDGSRLNGVQSLAALARKSGCTL